MKDKDKIALFMEMRLGKTLVAIRWAESKNPSRVLVVLPKSLFATWGDELASEKLRSVRLVGPEKDWKPFLKKRTVRWFLTNYERLRASPWLVNHPWDVVICDESTKIRKPTAQITQLLADGRIRTTERAKLFRVVARKDWPAVGITAGQKMWKWQFSGGLVCRSKIKPDDDRLERINVSKYEGVLDIPHKAILSGMPAPESVMDFFTQMKFLHGSFMGLDNYYHFQRRHCHQDGFKWIPKIRSKKDIRSAIHSQAFCLSRKEAGMDDQVVYERRVIEMPPKLAKVYRETEEQWTLDGADTQYKLVLMTWLSRLAGGCHDNHFYDYKIKEVVDLLKEEMRGEPVVVWFRYNKELAHMSRALSKAKLPHVWVTGNVPGDERELRRRKLQDGKVNIMLAQAVVAQYGLDMSRASTALWYSRWYHGEINAQAADRIVHPKKHEPLLHVDFVGEGTIDEQAVQTVREKHHRAKEFTKRMIELMDKKQGVNHAQQNQGS